MRKLLFAVSVLAWSGLALAGEYHRLAQLRCTDCHTMHHSRQHSMAQDGSGPTGLENGTATPNDSLLIAGSVNETCLACHDNQSFAPGVTAAGPGSTPALHRSAGFLSEVGDANATHGHTLDGISTAPPGWPGVVTWLGQPMECENCHAVHGSRAYRNAGLGRVAVSQGFPSSGANSFSEYGATYSFVATGSPVDPNYDVTVVTNGAGQALDAAKGLVANTYDAANIMFGKGANNANLPLFTGAGIPGVTTPKVLSPNGMNRYCARCHGNFHGDVNILGSVVGTTQHYIRHPTSGVVRTDTTFSTGTFTGVQGLDPMVTMNSAQGGLVRAVFTASDKGSWEVGCLTCHKAHGNGRPFGLLYPSHLDGVTDYENGDAAALSDGTYPIRNLCVTCHGMGRNY